MDSKDKMQVIYQGQQNAAMENAITEAAKLQGFELVSNKMDFKRGVRVLQYRKEEKSQ